MAKNIHRYRITVRGALPSMLNGRVASIHASAILNSKVMEPKTVKICGDKLCQKPLSGNNKLT